MQGDNPISWLMFFTLAAGVVIVGGLFLNFIRSHSNREAAEHALEGDGRSRGMAASGAGPELIAVAVFAFMAMGLLAFGYNNSSGIQTAEAPTQSSGQTTGQSGGMAQPSTLNQPKPYQPANPATDQRVSPTGSNAGVTNSMGTQAR